ncbi:MAG: S-layer homology domain-containing protein [Clostridia bacterium]|nr:S-layer homology domain-containing protein [Clostridia bacterium]
MKLLKRYCALLLLAMMMLLGASFIAEAAEATPFKQHKLPGKINMADFDLGGPGVGHSRMNGQPESYAEKYRDDATLNFYSKPVLHMGSMPPMWYQYTVEVTKAGSYDVYASAAAMYSPHFIVSVDGVEQGEGDVRGSGNWSNFWSSKIATVELTEGKHVITLEHTGAGANIYELNFEYMGQASNVHLAPTEGAYRFHYLPTKIQAEDYDVDNYASLDGTNDGGSEYRKDDPMDILTDEFEEEYEEDVWEEFERTSLALKPKEYVTYTVTVENPGAYSLAINAIKNSTITAYINDVEVAAADVSGCLYREAQEIATVWLPKGEHKLKIACHEKSAEIDYISFLETDTESYTLENFVKPEDEEETEVKVLDTVYKDIYVAPNGNDENDGSKASPFKTWQRANEEVQKYNKDMTGHIVVHFAGGDYPVKEMMTMDEKISGRNGYKVIYKGDELLNPPRFNGGTKVTGWQPQEGSPIWVADASHVEDTRNMYVNEFPAALARSRYRYQPSGLYQITGSKYDSDGFIVPQSNFPKSFTHPEDMMIVWPILWTTSRTPVDDVFYGDTTVTFKMQQPVWTCATSLGGAGHLNVDPSDSFILENAIELLDEPGEFFFDKYEKKLYYYPYKEEDMTTADVWVSTTEKLLNMSGSSLQNKVQNVEFNNLRFQYGAWNELSQTGMKENQTDQMYIASTDDAIWHKEIMKPAQVTIEAAQYIDIKNCEFVNLGSNCLNMTNGILNSNIVGNLFRDSAATGLVVGNWNHKVELSDDQERCEYINISNNAFHRVAYEICGSAAMAVYYPAHVVIDHNDVRDVPYTGISVGWGWGAWNPPDVRDIHVLSNYVENVTSQNFDGAHIYTLGRMEESTIKYNHLVESGDTRGGIYLDEASAAITVEENVVQRATNPIFARAGAIIRDIYANNNYVDTEDTGFTAETDDSHRNKIDVTYHILDGKWPDRAKEIMADAGLQPQYTNLLKEAAYPDWRVFAWEYYADSLYKLDVVPDVNRWVLGQEYDDFFEISHAKPTVYAGGHLGDTKPGEWVSFNVHVEDEGIYDLSIRGSDGWTGGTECTAKLTLDDEVIADGFVIKRGGWDLKNFAVGKVYLTKGDHVFKMEVQGNDWMVGGFIFDNGKVLPDDPNYDDCMLIDQATFVERFAEGFTDIEGHWAYYSIVDMTDSGYIKGYDKHTFAPDDAVTLHQACMLALRVLGSESDDGWQERAAELKMLTSAAEGDMKVSRERFIDIIMKAYVSAVGNYQITVGEEYFSDAANISEQYRQAMFGANELELIEGYEDGTIRPHNTLTRAEAVTILYRFADTL